MSLPHATQSQIKAMQKAAQEKFGVEEETPEQVEQVEEPVQEQPEEVEEVEETSQPQEEEKKSSKEENLRILRERSERAERERDELMRQLQAMQPSASKPSQQQEIQNIKDDIDDLSFNPDDLAEGKHLIQLVNKIKKLEKKLEDSSQATQMTATEMKIRRDFPDFEKVASYDNLKKLREIDEDLADAILSTKDPYKQHALAYKMVKQMGIYREDLYGKEREIAQKNASKPRPLTSISPQQSDSPLTKANAFANGLTDELREQLHREMMESIKNR